jgi:hypothetical protein
LVVFICCVVVDLSTRAQPLLRLTSDTTGELTGHLQFTLLDLHRQHG